MKPPTRRKRKLLEAAHKGTLRDLRLTPEQSIATAELISDGLLTHGRDGIAITVEGCHAIGKKPPKKDINLAAIATVNINTLAPQAQQLLLGLAPTDGADPTDPDVATSTVLTLAIACGMINKVLNVPPERLLEAIHIGMRAKSHATDEQPV